MLDLSNITLLSINTVNPYEAVKALRYCTREIEFKEVLLFTHENANYHDIQRIKVDEFDNLHGYSDFCLRLADYINSDYVLIVQDDGFILNPNRWEKEFLNYDYIGAPWPAEQSWIDLQKSRDFMKPGYNQVGNGGFSLRSRKFLNLSAMFLNCEGYAEDAFLCNVKYDFMIKNGIKFAPLDMAKRFSYENPLENWSEMIDLDASQHFGFHGRRFSNSSKLINLKN